jgi:archaemetzincin
LIERQSRENNKTRLCHYETSGSTGGQTVSGGQWFLGKPEMSYRKNVKIVSIGRVNQDLVEWLKGSLSEDNGLVVQIGESIDIPGGALNKESGQYLGDALLEALHMLRGSEKEIVLGLTDQDCYVEGMNYIFGQATLKGNQAFVALKRLHESFYGREENESLFRNRVLKESLHELGHTFGLSHCSNKYCVMHFSNFLADTDKKEGSFVGNARNYVSTRLRISLMNNLLNQTCKIPCNEWFQNRCTETVF